MEATAGIVFRAVPGVSGAGADACSLCSPNSSLSVSGFDQLLLLGRYQNSNAMRRKSSLFMKSGFCGNGVSTSPSIRCGGGKKKDATAKKMIKRRLKSLRGLSRDMSMMDDHQLKMKTISEATETLIAELEELKAEEKVLMRKRKEENGKIKNSVPCCEDSSSESSDDECGDVVNMKKETFTAPPAPLVNQVQPLEVQDEATTLKTTVMNKEGVIETQIKNDTITALPPARVNQVQPIKVQVEATALKSTPMNKENVLEIEMQPVNKDASLPRSSSSIPTVSEAEKKKIEVCMGGKCKKSGAVALMEEFKRVLGDEGAVVGCKCMRKCKVGPNVRVVNHSQSQIADKSLREPPIPLCIGVGLGDVSSIVANFLEETPKDAAG